METPDHIARLRIVGGNFALDFVNTQDGEPDQPAEDDALREYADVVAWGDYVGILTSVDVDRLLRRARRNPADAHGAYERATRLRGNLYEVFRGVALGRPPPRRHVDAVRHDEVDALARAELEWVGERFEWRWPHGDDLDGPLRPVVHAAIELLTVGPLERVKGCAGCRWLFLDESKNRSRRWCAMEDCGTVEKMRRYIARRAAARR